ncbi:MAG TPA: hypothetical protein ENL41_01330 [candidate division WOR-3 bacterium]|uniref:CopG family transcriptional regulator n=1 Tax=candidate division WOR-3 bacterium TaxID=2052148 RepID=A0A7C5I4E7_UNCW3|nr:hypothetical protein [candidate division WOR-3 bacterium]
MREREVKIPEGLYKLIEENLKELGAKSVEEFVVNAARVALQEATNRKLEIDEKEKEEIKRRLRELGYID